MDKVKLGTPNQIVKNHKITEAVAEVLCIGPVFSSRKYKSNNLFSYADNCNSRQPGILTSFVENLRRKALHLGIALHHIKQFWC